MEMLNLEKTEESLIPSLELLQHGITVALSDPRAVPSEVLACLRLDAHVGGNVHELAILDREHDHMLTFQ
jgi:hypothetical protein